MDDDGVNHFGTHTDQPEAAHWDTPEWREEMRGLYGDGVQFNADLNRWIDPSDITFAVRD